MTIPPPEVCCQTCHFFSPAPWATDKQKGQCRFRAPILDLGGSAAPRTIWPLVRGSDWCGEHAVLVEDAD